MVIGRNRDSAVNPMLRTARVLLRGRMPRSRQLRLIGKVRQQGDPKYGVFLQPPVSLSANPCQRAVAPTASASRIRGDGFTFRKRTPVIAGGHGLWYGDDFHGRLTANGEVFDMASLTAAHRPSRLPCYARMTNLNNGKSLIVRVNDRGPYHGNRLIDVSNKAAELLESKAMA